MWPKPKVGIYRLFHEAMSKNEVLLVVYRYLNRVKRYNKIKWVRQKKKRSQEGRLKEEKSEYAGGRQTP